MPTIYANGKDDSIDTGQQANHAAARGFTGIGTLDGAGDTSTAYGPGYFVFTGRGGATYRIHRVFMFFDTSGVSSVDTATLKLYYESISSGMDIRIFKSDAFGGDGDTLLAAIDFDNLDWNTPYGAIDLDAGNGTYSITLSSDAKTDMVNDDVLIIAIVQGTNDYGDYDPGTATNYQKSATLRMADYTGTSFDPRIEYTLPGYTHDVSGLAAASISKVDEVATANIGKINGLD